MIAEEIRPRSTAPATLPMTKASQIQPDAVTGATFSSDALIKNVHTGLEYYKKHK
ncbi:MAG: FMN-binding protein [Hoylesella saccharolytica]